MARFELVIFDCDGVLVDSELISNAVYAEMLSELGLPMSVDDALGHFAGHAMAHSLELVASLLGGAIPSGFVAEYQARAARALEQQLLPVAGVREVSNCASRPASPPMASPRRCARRSSSRVC